RVDYRLLRFLAVPLLLVAVILLGAVLVPGVGVTAGGATRWLRFGAFGLQPAELAKLALIVYLATWLGGKREQIGSWRITLPFILVTALVVGLVVAEPDLGTAIVVVVVALAMYFAAGARLREYAALGGLAGVVVLALLVLALAFRGVRIALRARVSTGACLATGVTMWLCCQAGVNMAVVAILVPVTGVTLPFISYGGSSLCVGLIAVGILLNVGREAGPTVSRAPGRRRNGRSYQPAARDRRGAARPGPRGAAPVHRWSSRARG